MNDLNISIDDMLEEVAIAMAEGNNQHAKKLLPQIIDSGDETQQLMAESYQMQLDLLIEIEGEEEGVDEECFDSYDAGECLIDFVTQTEEVVPALAQQETAVSNESILSEDGLSGGFTAKYFMGDVDLVRGSADASGNKINDLFNSSFDDSGVDNINVEAASIADNADCLLNVGESSEELSVKSDDVTERDQVMILDINASKEGMAPLESSLNVSDKSELKNVLQTKFSDEEVNIALEQVAILVEEGELETADMLFKEIIGKASVEQLSSENSSVCDSEISSYSPNPEPEEVVYKALVEEKSSNQSSENVMLDASDTSTSMVCDREESFVKDESKDNVFDSIFESSSSLVQGLVDREGLIRDESHRGFEESENAYPSIDSFTSPLLANHMSFDDQEERVGAVDSLLAPSSLLDSYALGDTESSLEGKVSIFEQRQGFFVGGVGLMIKFADGNELMELPKYCRVPNSPNWFVGLTNLHGVVIPIFDLTKFLQINSPKNTNVPMLLVLFHEGEAIGVLIDSLPNRLFFDESKKMAHNTAPPQLKEHIYSAYLINNKLWYDLNSFSLSSALEASMR